jgi:hypothetical protein
VSRELKRPLGSEMPRMEPTSFPFPSRCPAILAEPLWKERITDCCKTGLR